MADSTPNGSRDMLQMVFQFQTSARAEVAHRVGLRDTALFLFLAASASLFGVALNESYRPVLYAIPLLGLGASQVFTQHNIVIGAITRYLGIEVTAWLRANYPNSPLPVQWNNSRSYLGMRGGAFTRPVLFSGLTLIVFPQALALVVVTITQSPSLLTFVGVLTGLASAGLSLSAILSAHRTRSAYEKELRRFSEAEHHLAKTRPTFDSKLPRSRTAGS
ncbi:hypothetical protein [Micromonospora sp. S4605]|uniref:hypothetical protein n=1 Tax=Micromonospora sp. S4605 TaxID=1420897 RepID=UPI0011B4BE10|nr:hypothetical protein [Micromonospora sp. S4605]